MKWLGAPCCPGCGLGHSISYMLHGNWQAAFKSHPLGPFAIIILLYRTFQLGRLYIMKPKNHYT